MEVYYLPHKKKNLKSFACLVELASFEENSYKPVEKNSIIHITDQLAEPLFGWLWGSF